MPAVQIFLSAVSAEFQSYREALRRDLTRPNITVAIQEDFIASGSATLDKLDDYIKQCDAVIHLVGDMTGAWAEAPSLALTRERYPDMAQRLPPLQDVLTGERSNIAVDGLRAAAGLRRAAHTRSRGVERASRCRRHAGKRACGRVKRRQPGFELGNVLEPLRRGLSALLRSIDRATKRSAA